MKHVRLLSSCAILASTLLFTSCMDDILGNDEQPTAQTQVKIAFEQGTPICTIATRGELYAYGADFDTIWGSANVDSLGFYGELSGIPIGGDRTVGVNIFDSLDVLKYHGEDVTDVVAGMNDPLYIQLRPVSESGTIPVIGEVVEGGVNARYIGEYDRFPSDAQVKDVISDRSGDCYIYTGNDWDLAAKSRADTIWHFDTIYGDSVAYPEWDTTYVIGEITVPEIPVFWQGTFYSAPASPAKFSAYYNVRDNKSYYFNGREWKNFIETTNLITEIYQTVYYDTTGLWDSLYIDTLVYDSLYIDTIVHDSLYIDTIVHDSLYFDSLGFESLIVDTVVSSYDTTFFVN